MIKAVFFDIDGTLLDHSPEGGSQMPASTRRALKALGESGVGLYIASGRIPGWVTFLAELYPFDGYVTVNGQLATDRAGQVLHRMAHREEDIRRLVELYQKEPFACILIEEEETFALGPDACIRQHFAWAGLPAPALYDIARLKDHPVLQFCMYTPAREAQRLLAPLEHIEITSAGGDILDVIPQGGGKEVGIAAVAERFGWKREEVMVFGDGDNDCRMLRWAGTGVALGNGTPAAKAAADYVTAPIGQDGVEKALVHFGLLPG